MLCIATKLNYNQLDNLIPDPYPVDPKELGLGGMAGGDLELEPVNDWDSTDCGIKFLFLTSHGFSGADIIKYGGFKAWERSVDRQWSAPTPCTQIFFRSLYMWKKMATDVSFTIRQVAPADQTIETVETLPRTEEDEPHTLPRTEEVEPHGEEGINRRAPRRATKKRKKKEEPKEKSRKPPG